MIGHCKHSLAGTGSPSGECMMCFVAHSPRATAYSSPCAVRPESPPIWRVRVGGVYKGWLGSAPHPPHPPVCIYLPADLPTYLLATPYAESTTYYSVGTTTCHLRSVAYSLVRAPPRLRLASHYLQSTAYLLPPRLPRSCLLLVTFPRELYSLCPCLVK